MPATGFEFFLDAYAIILALVFIGVFFTSDDDGPDQDDWDN